MKPSEEWLKTWNEKRNLLACPNNLNDYFEETTVGGKKSIILNLAAFPFQRARFWYAIHWFISKKMPSLI
ncbi:hypothetical protein [Pedobacter alluvionis]|uniref:hypothetical protein n=1 Tax=Pedobacter alluvionis TaxID=475253 RepID=UPI001ABC0DF0|nr:hypothetical protein [Pedobacter alluvionis]